MKFLWKNRYSETLEPDEHNRWAMDCYCFLNLSSLDKTDERFQSIYDEKEKMVRMATIVQKGTVNGSVPSLIHKFCCSLPTFRYINEGFSDSSYLYSNDINELKYIVEKHIIDNVLIFKNFV